MKTRLYDLRRGAKFKLLEHPKQPPDIVDGADRRGVYTLNNIDGMYSHVTGSDGKVYHFAAWTEVEEEL